MPTTLSAIAYNNYIDGRWMPSTSGETFENRNPANTDDLVGTFQKSTRRDVEQALDAARRAYEGWRMVPAPRRAVNCVKVREDAGVPAGVVNMVTGDGDEVGTPLTTHEAVRVVSFTGSTHVGRVVNQAAAPGFKKVHLEMVGKNVIMIMDDAD